MSLILEIEHLMGVAFAARGPESAEPDWPPQPDRIFSALVAAWAARGGLADEREALEWLEKQPDPRIEASDAFTRPAPASFVPPNDKLQITANAAWRTRQPRRFPAALPFDPKLRIVWADASDAPLELLDGLARDVGYVGHSASLTRCSFSLGAAGAALASPKRRIYPGRLRELEVAFQRSRRPSPGDAAPGPEAEIATSASTFANDWLTFEIVAHDLDFRAAPLACKALIKAVMSGYAAVAGRDGIPAWVSGHGGDGSPGKDPHLAAVPLAFAGFKHGDGALMGFALVPPVGRDDLLADPMFRKAMFAITASGADGRRILPLVVGRTGALDIALTFGTERASLNPERYLSVAKYWGTVTPLVLDRHVSGDDPQTEIEDLIADACGRSLGVRPKRVVAHKHSAIQGAPSAYPSGNAPRWTGWRVPETLKSRRLTHAVLEFEGDVAGPLMIGAGRFCGLGLCLPLGAPAE